MKAKIKTIVAMILSLCMITACGNQPAVKEETKTSTVTSESSVTSENNQEESKYPEYLNLDSAYPIVKDEYADDITLKVLIRMQDGAGEFDELWISKYLSEKYNINFDVECTFGSNHNERKSLMFASNELPDILINPTLTTAEMVKYGAEEGLLLQLDSYINETLTPNIAKYVVGDAKAACTANDGHMYTLPYMQNTNDPNANVTARMFITHIATICSSVMKINIHMETLPVNSTRCWRISSASGPTVPAPAADSVPEKRALKLWL